MTEDELRVLDDIETPDYITDELQEFGGSETLVCRVDS
jgi:hypothetical protein